VQGQVDQRPQHRRSLVLVPGIDVDPGDVPGQVVVIGGAFVEVGPDRPIDLGLLEPSRR
jgi:hypothetical protein